MTRSRRIAAIGALVVAHAASVRAQSLGLAPADIRAAFKPGQIIQFDLSVSNDGDTPVSMRTSVMDLWYDELTNEKIFGVPGTLPRSAANWVTFVPPTFTAPAHGTGKVHVTITPPPDATGGAYAVLFVESKPEPAATRAPDGRAMFANVRLGALALLTAEGTDEYQLDVTDTKLTPPGPSENLSLDLQLANKGNVHVFPQPRLTILNASKQVMGRAEGEPKRLLPGQRGSVGVSWAGSLPSGDYTAVVTLTYGKDKIYTRELPLHVAESQHQP
jgi:hypothetical protein